MSELSALGYDIYRYFVRQILDSLGLRERSFYKDLPMKDVKDRNEQFEQIGSPARFRGKSSKDLT